MSEPLYAFPCTHDVQPEPGFKRGILVERGMTLRDYFAGQALIGMLASERESDDMKIVDYASDCYRYADAMLKARDA